MVTVVALSAGFAGAVSAYALHVAIILCGASLFSSKHVKLSVTYKYIFVSAVIDMVALIALIYLVRNTQWTV